MVGGCSIKSSMECLAYGCLVEWYMFETYLILAVIILTLLGLGYAYDRWLSPWLARRWVRRKLTEIKDAKNNPPAKTSYYCISVDANGVSVTRKQHPGSPLHVVAWQDIVRALVYKQDLFVVDCISLALVAVDGSMIEVNEEMEGWELLTKSLPQYLPGCKPWHEWFILVAFPAFAENKLVVFERNDAKNDKME